MNSHDSDMGLVPPPANEINSSPEPDSSSDEKDCKALSRAFSSQSPEVVEAMLVVLSCIATAFRPLILKELRAATWLWMRRFERRQLRQKVQPPSSKTVLDCCAPFLKRTSKDEVKFACSGMTEHLKTTGLSKTIFDHSILAEICIDCIPRGPVPEQSQPFLPRDTEFASASLRNRVTMIAYAQDNWFHHLRLAQLGNIWLRQSFDRMLEAIVCGSDDVRRDLDIVGMQKSDNTGQTQISDIQGQKILLGLQMCIRYRLNTLEAVYEAAYQGLLKQKSTMLQKSRPCSASYPNWRDDLSLRFVSTK